VLSAPSEVNVGDIVWAAGWTIGAVVLGVLMIVLMALSGKENPMRLLTGVDGHLALSQTQIACWTIVVGSVVLGYGLIRRNIPDIPESLLVLMGTSLATGGLAFFSDTKSGIAATASGATVTTRSWAWSDLIRIFPTGGPPELSLAKAQMLFWTALLLVLFVSKSILEGEIWDVPWPLVALLGFSQAGYLAPKLANADAPATSQPPGAPAAVAPPVSPTPPAPPAAAAPTPGTGDVSVNIGTTTPALQGP
jgi:hypothetical protein